MRQTLSIPLIRKNAYEWATRPEECVREPGAR